MLTYAHVKGNAIGLEKPANTTNMNGTGSNWNTKNNVQYVQKLKNVIQMQNSQNGPSRGIILAPNQGTVIKGA